MPPHVISARQRWRKKVQKPRSSSPTKKNLGPPYRPCGSKKEAEKERMQEEGCKVARREVEREGKREGERTIQKSRFYPCLESIDYSYGWCHGSHGR